MVNEFYRFIFQTTKSDINEIINEFQNMIAGKQNFHPKVNKKIKRKIGDSHINAIKEYIYRNFGRYFTV